MYASIPAGACCAVTKLALAITVNPLLIRVLIVLGRLKVLFNNCVVLAVAVRPKFNV